MKTAKLTVFSCAAVLVILGVYSLLVSKYVSGIIRTVLGIFFFILGSRLN